LILSLSACQAKPTEQTQATATLEPTSTPTPEPLGSEGNPVILGLVPSESAPNQVAQAATLAEQISTAVGFTVKVLAVDDFDLLLNEMQAGTVQMAFLQPMTYITARQNNLAEVALLTNHFGVYYYGTQFIANLESGFQTFFDPKNNVNTADSATALPQLTGKKACWAESNSISGYILPAGILAENGISITSGATLASQTAIIRALYIKGVCDFGVTFAISGDPRTSSAVINDLTDVRERVPILWQSDPVIPNLNLSYTPSLAEVMRAPLTQAFLDLARTEEGKALLSAAAGDYEIQDMREVDDSVYDPLRDAVDALGFDVYTALGK
jgi:phosphonate transport system substrate-binding protein